MKKIIFLTDTPATYMFLGSYRIWINDLCAYLNACSINSEIKNVTEFSITENNSDIIICGKNDAHLSPIIKNHFPNKLVGIINPVANGDTHGADFAIAGSIEEKCSLSFYDNVVLFPLIEKMYQAKHDYKTHTDTGTIRIAYHGNSVHLNRFSGGLDKALERLNKDFDIELVLLCPSVSQWVYGKPNIKKIRHKTWQLDSIKQDILNCDIGIVPNISVLSPPIDANPEIGTYDTDYILRFKNKSNAGRSFVFHQLGIPVVSDLTPSNFHILGNPENGFIANNEESWYKSLYILMNAENRQKIADSAKKEFDRLYNPLEWAQKFYQKLESILQR